MANIPLGPWKVGIDHLSPKASAPDGAARDAVNVDFDRDGGAARRSGYSLKDAAANAHSLWTSPATGRSFCVYGSTLYTVTYEGSWVKTAVGTLPSIEPISYDDLGEDVVCGNRHGLFRVKSDLTMQSLGLARPDAPTVSATAYGGLYQGRYAVAVARLRDYEEGPLSPSAFIDVPAGGGLLVTTPAHDDSIRLYRTQTNGDHLFACGVAPAASQHLIGIGEVGWVTENQHLDQMPGGEIVRHWRGLVLVARGSIIYWSEPMAYGITDPRHNFVQFANKVTLMQPVDGGIFVGTREGVIFLSGSTPKEWSIKKTDGLPAVEGTGVTALASLFGVDAGDGKVALWLAANGFVIGTPDGRLIEAQAKRIRLPESQVAAGVGAAVVHDRQIIASIN